MKKIATLCFFIFNTAVLFSQQPPFFDSAGFFTRNKIKEVYIKDFCDDTILGERKIMFDKKHMSVRSCGEYDKKEGLRGTQIGKWDCGVVIDLITNYTDTTMILENRPTTFTFDKHNRLLKKSVNETNPDQAVTPETTEYYYSDSVTKRLQSIIKKGSEYEHTDSTLFFYNNNVLVKVIETHDSNIKGRLSYKTVWVYEYYADGKLKRICYDDLHCTCGIEYGYKYYK